MIFIHKDTVSSKPHTRDSYRYAPRPKTSYKYDFAFITIDDNTKALRTDLKNCTHAVFVFAREEGMSLPKDYLQEIVATVGGSPLERPSGTSDEEYDVTLTRSLPLITKLLSTHKKFTVAEHDQLIIEIQEIIINDLDVEFDNMLEWIKKPGISFSNGSLEKQSKKDWENEVGKMLEEHVTKVLEKADKEDHDLDATIAFMHGAIQDIYLNYKLGL